MPSDTSRPVPKRVTGRHACERCRKAKIRCLTDTLESHGRCRKCYSNGLDCEWKEISKTRNRGRANARVADLERQLSSLTAAVDGMINRTSPHRPSDQDDGSEVLHTPATTSLSSDQLRNATINVPPYPVDSSVLGHHQQSPNQSCMVWSTEPLQANTFSAEAKGNLVETFITKMLPHYPVISIPKDVPLEELEASKPFTMQAIITTACSISEPQSFRTMHDRNVAMLSKAVVVQGRKSIDLLQALLITATWACPPENLSDLNIYQWSHMACTMALELGLGGRVSLQAQAQDVAEFAATRSDASMEKYRTMFGAYLTCSRSVTPFELQRACLQYFQVGCELSPPKNDILQPLYGLGD